MKNEQNNKVEEPAVDYGKKRLTFFNSFEEAELHGLKEMAKHTPQERLANLETLRKRFLLKGDTWQPLKRVVTIIKGTVV